MFFVSHWLFHCTVVLFDSKVVWKFTAIEKGPSYSKFESFTLVDLNNDNLPDLLFTFRKQEEHTRVLSLAWFESLGNGDFDFKENVIFSFDCDASSRISQLRLADLNKDGNMDILVSYTNMCGPDTNYSNADRQVWFENRGYGRFSEHLIFATAGDTYVDLLPIDLNDDSLVDVLASDFIGGFVLYQNVGDSLFQRRMLAMTSRSVDFMVAASLISGSRSDVIVGGSSRPLSWCQNIGNGALSNETVISLTNSVTGIVPIDLNNDGRVDVLTPTSRGVLWYENLGNGMFSSKGFNLASKVSYVLPTDLNSDGLMDVLSFSVQLEWYANAGDGDFRFVTSIHIPGYPQHLLAVAIDLNSDGFLDIISASSTPYSLPAQIVISTSRTCMFYFVRNSFSTGIAGKVALQIVRGDFACE